MTHYSSALSDESDGFISPPPSPTSPHPMQHFHRRAPLPLAYADAELARLPPAGGISLDQLGEWEKERAGDVTARLAQTLLSRCSMGAVLVGRGSERKAMTVFNTKVWMKGLPVTDQKASGRCWLFALCNVLRGIIADKYKVENFQLSQSYLAFWDHYSKAEYFLHQMVELVDEPLTSRLMKQLVDNSIQDGGDYDLACSLIQRFGVVPQSIYPESFNSSNSKEVDTFLTSKLCEYMLDIRNGYVHLREAGHNRVKALELIGKLIPGFMKEIYRVLAITLGTPPLPNAEFHWSFNTTTHTTHTLTRTPLTLLSLDLTPTCGSLSETLALMHDPRPSKRFGAAYGVDRGRGMVGGRRVRNLNVEVGVLKGVAVGLLRAGHPVWFACDVDKASSPAEGIMDLALYDYSDAFGTTLNLNKSHRLQSGDGEPTHAMVLTAVHIDPHTGETVRWQVENSWGPDACNHGFWCMTDAWFSEHVYQIGAPRAFVPPELVRQYDAPRAGVMPAWDPMA